MKKSLVRMAAMAAAMLMSFCVMAQDVELVVLQHGNNVSAYYGSQAFIQALNAAQHGDLISLSAGVFAGTTIDKAVTIQGAGYTMKPDEKKFRTVISYLNISIPENQTGLSIEGIYSDVETVVFGNLNDFKFKKSRLKRIFFKDGIGTNGRFEQCRIEGLYLRKSKNILLNKCIILSAESDDGSTVSVTHCYLRSGGVRGSFSNSIIAGGETSESSYYYNVLCDDPHSSVMVGNEILEGDIFNIFTDPYKAQLFFDDYDYRLSDGSSHRGSDGTEVGVYGSSSPFTDVPTNPQITSSQVASQVDSDGKLSVKFTVSAQQ